MTAQQLKNAILQQAIQGRLVPQDPADEPASVLLDRIRHEKEQLVKQGKLKKKDLTETPITPDEIPFDIPDSWEWVSLSSLFDIFTGKKDANFGVVDGKYDFFTCSSIPKKSPTYSYDGEYLIMPGNGANIGQVVHYKGKFEAYQRTYLLQSFGPLNLDYIKYHLMYNWKEYNQDKLYGSAIPYIKLGNLTSYLVALPPLAEQHRIVAKIEQLLNEIDKLKA
jgi:type I restriction enzyme S subunit